MSLRAFEEGIQNLARSLRTRPFVVEANQIHHDTSSWLEFGTQDDSKVRLTVAKESNQVEVRLHSVETLKALNDVVEKYFSCLNEVEYGRFVTFLLSLVGERETLSKETEEDHRFVIQSLLNIFSTVLPVLFEQKDIYSRDDARRFIQNYPIFGTAAISGIMALAAHNLPGPKALVIAHVTKTIRFIPINKPRDRDNAIDRTLGGDGRSFYRYFVEEIMSKSGNMIKHAAVPVEDGRICYSVACRLPTYKGVRIASTSFDLPMLIGSTPGSQEQTDSDSGIAKIVKAIFLNFRTNEKFSVQGLRNKLPAGNKSIADSAHWRSLGDSPFSAVFEPEKVTDESQVPLLKDSSEPFRHMTAHTLKKGLWHFLLLDWTDVRVLTHAKRLKRYEAMMEDDDQTAAQPPKTAC